MSRAIAFLFACAGVLSCAAASQAPLQSTTSVGSGGSNGSGAGGHGGDTGLFGDDSTGTGSSNADCGDVAKIVYLVTLDGQIYSFDPTVPGLSAYERVGTLDCPASGQPQSMAIDRKGIAWVFFDSQELFEVTVVDAACYSSTKYRSPAISEARLGSGFTAVAADSPQERLFILSPDFGLATVNVDTAAVDPKGVFQGIAAELTGGPDGRLFRFAAEQNELAEVDPSTYEVTPIHTFTEFTNAKEWAFARYAGVFYMFTSPGDGTNSQTTMFDPMTGTTTVRDTDIGIRVLGAGQSTCVPPPPPQ